MKKLALAFNHPGHSIADMGLIPLELQPTLSRSRLQEAREAYLIEEARPCHQTVWNEGMNIELFLFLFLLHNHLPQYIILSSIYNCS